MNHLLKHVEVNLNADMFGGSDRVTELAISSDIELLKTVCETAYGCEPSIGEPPKKFGWEYYMIVETNIIII